MSIKTIFHCGLLWALGLFLLVPASGWGKEVLSKRTRDLFEWYNHLGFEEVGRGTFVEVAMGDGVEFGEGKPKPELREGFLMVETPKNFTVTHVDLSTQTYSRVNGEDLLLGRYRKISFEQRVREVLRQMRKEDYFKTWTGATGGRSELTSRSGQIFVLARECERRALAPLAEQLIQALARHPAVEGPNGREEMFPANIRSQLATAANSRAWSALHDASKSWEEVAKLFRGIVEYCPESENTGQAKLMLGMLERSIADAAEHARTGPKSLEGLAAADQARELVWRLRDVTIHPDSEAPSIPPGGREVIAMLKEMGMEAVPALLAELRAPEHLSRASLRPNSISYFVTQELVSNILSETAGIGFESFADREKPEVRWQKLGEAAEGWWNSSRAGKEQEWLENVVRQGGMTAVACAGRLHERYPVAYADAALEGFIASRRGEEADAGRDLLRGLAGHRGPQVEAALIGLLASADDEDRLTIALLLRDWKLPEGSAAMRAKWEAVMAGTLPSLHDRNRGRERPMRSLADMLVRVGSAIPHGIVSPGARGVLQAIKFLVESDDPQNLRAVLDSWPKLSFEYRHLLVELVVGGGADDGFSRALRSSAAHRVFCQELLLTALEDERESPEWVTSYFDGAFPYPRLCDLAARGLNLRWHDKYAFDFPISKDGRDRQRLRILNAQRRELGQPEVSMPPERARVPEAKANEVTAVEWDEDSVPPDETLNHQAAAWKGRPLEIAAIVSTVIHYTKKPQTGTVRFRVVVSRDADSTGVVVRLRLGAGQPKTPASYWRGGQLVIINRGLNMDSRLGIQSGGPFGQEAWDTFKRHMDAALRTPAPTTFAAIAEAVLEE